MQVLSSQLVSAGAGLLVNRRVGSSVLPPIGVPYAGALPMWSLPRASFVGLHLQTQSYMPVVVSHFQSIIPANGWSTYMTLVRYKLPVVVIVFNNNGVYGGDRMNPKEVSGPFKDDPAPTSFVPGVAYQISC
ncbi:hypothetical protein J1N35_005284 [Gossypium stocksii]|uniref:Thiamine pyrophosphate enzyme TPP-binding domain-containing protein n=1 Tax=Gossypium stocksii TaxID=47602 RepID=A0A9D3WDI2_9ROSI|nr:hypothetical protein J1N35_005284 [Gossypium stocksii]